MKSDRALSLTLAKNRYDQGIKTGTTSWPKLVSKLTKFTVTDETFEEYLNAGNDKLAIKDTGWFIGGPMEPAVRRKDNLKHRDILTLDADHLDWLDMDELMDEFSDLEFVVHSSHSHSEDRPRLRFVFPFTRTVGVDEYEPIARFIASLGGIDRFDDTTYQVSRIMFWPSRSVDGPEFTRHNTGQWLDPDKVLEKYDDWKDWGDWPTSSREKSITRDPSKRADNPFTKPGVIGAFNRAFEVPHAIEEFDLPYEPSGMGEGRYSYTGGTSADGCVYYPDDGHLYSWHESDPARGNRNAWDLVRLHLFGDKDARVANDTPVGKMPSQIAMRSWASGIPEVVEEMASHEGFEALGDEPSEPEPRKKDDQVDRKAAASGPDTGVRDQRVPDIAVDYDGLAAQISGRSAPLDRGEVNALIRGIAAAQMSAAEEDMLAAQLVDAGAIKIAKKSILDSIKTEKRKQMTQTASGDARDIELDLIERVLEEHFDGGKHIRRFARQFWTYEHGVWIQRADEWVRGKMQDSFIGLRRERPKDVIALVAEVADGKTSEMTGRLWVMFCAFVAGSEQSTDPLGLLQRDKDPVLNVQNGHIVFRKDPETKTVSWKLQPHDPSLFLTTQIPLDFEPGADRGYWDRFTDLLFHESDDIPDNRRHLEEVGGYTLQEWRSLPTFFLMRGEPAAGKSTFGALLNNLAGTGVLNRSIGSFGVGRDSHGEAALVGKLLLLDEDYDTGELLPAGFIKRISEEKQLAANPKGKDVFEFISRAVPFVISNDWPLTKDYSGALDRRLVCWDLPTIPLERQDDVERKRLLTVGLQGCLAAFVEGIGRVYARSAWERPSDCVEAAGTWRKNADAVAQWLSTTCVRYNVTTKKGMQIMLPRSECYGFFVEWFRDNKQGIPPGKIKFLSRLNGQLGAPIKRNGVFGYPGVRHVGLDAADEFDA